ncbi:MAG: hypothetical protein ACM3QS_18720 [Bacteroidota bacterium]
MDGEPKLNPDDLLKAEYEYIARTAFQANEDRARVTSFFFVSAGSLVAAILGTQLAEETLHRVSIAFSLLFVAMTGLGALTLAQLARLRAAWHESVEAMNQMKDFYLAHHPEIAPAFKWRGATIPPTDKRYSIANLIAVEVAMLSALTSAAAVYFLLLAVSDIRWWGWLLAAMALPMGYLALWSAYKKLLVDDR